MFPHDETKAVGQVFEFLSHLYRRRAFELFLRRTLLQAVS